MILRRARRVGRQCVKTRVGWGGNISSFVCVGEQLGEGFGGGGVTGVVFSNEEDGGVERGFSFAVAMGGPNVGYGVGAVAARVGLGMV